MKSRGTGPLAAVVTLLLLLAGCGDGDDTTATSGDGEAQPSRIVSLSPTATETLFAVGAGDQVVAVDDQSDYPPEAPTTGLSAYEPNVEAIAGYEPDLVVAPADAPRDVISSLRGLGITVIAQEAPTAIAEAYTQVVELGHATGHAESAQEVAAGMRAGVEEAIASAPEADGLEVFHELDPELFSASSGTFIGRIYARLGLENVADRAAERTGSPYPQLSEEALLRADPELIVLADSECCGQTPEKVADRPGWSSVAAVRSGSVVGIDDDIASRWGPRLPELVERVADALEPATRARRDR